MTINYYFDSEKLAHVANSKEVTFVCVSKDSRRLILLYHFWPHLFDFENVLKGVMTHRCHQRNSTADNFLFIAITT